MNAPNHSHGKPFEFQFFTALHNLDLAFGHGVYARHVRSAFGLDHTPTHTPPRAPVLARCAAGSERSV